VKSWNLEERCLAVFSEGGTSCLAEVVDRSSQAVDSHEGQYQCLESNASDYREPVEVAEEGGYMGEFW